MMLKQPMDCLHTTAFMLLLQEEFEDTNGGNQNPYIEGQTTQWPKDKVCAKGQTTIYKTYI